MSSTLTAVLFTLAAFAVAYALCEWILRRHGGGGSDDSAAG